MAVELAMRKKALAHLKPQVMQGVTRKGVDLKTSEEGVEVLLEKWKSYIAMREEIDSVGARDELRQMWRRNETTAGNQGGYLGRTLLPAESQLFDRVLARMDNEAVQEVSGLTPQVAALAVRDNVVDASRAHTDEVLAAVSSIGSILTNLQFTVTVAPPGQPRASILQVQPGRQAVGDAQEPPQPDYVKLTFERVLRDDPTRLPDVLFHNMVGIAQPPKGNCSGAERAVELLIAVTGKQCKVTLNKCTSADFKRYFLSDQEEPPIVNEKNWRVQTEEEEGCILGFPRPKAKDMFPAAVFVKYPSNARKEKIAFTNFNSGSSQVIDGQGRQVQYEPDAAETGARPLPKLTSHVIANIISFVPSAARVGQALQASKELSLSLPATSGVLFCAADFLSIVAGFFTKTDAQRVEAQFIGFGPVSGSIAPLITHMVITEHWGTATACGATAAGLTQLGQFQESNPHLKALVYWHSHHYLSEQPSDADVACVAGFGGGVCMAVSYAAKFRSLGDAADRAQGFQVWRLSKPVAEVQEYLAHDNADDTRTARSVLEQVVLHSRKDVARTVVCQMGGWVNQQAIR